MHTASTATMISDGYITINGHHSPSHLLPSLQGFSVSPNQPTWAPTSHIESHITSPTFNHFSMSPYPQNGGSSPQTINSDVIYALDIARDSPEGAESPVVMKLLNAALDEIWLKVMRQPNYVMTRDEFAVFNYFQHRFVNNKLAIAARRRYWDNTTGDEEPIYH
ncbi:hypothetical protein F5B20DRAFT_521365 [Whalleya microplaca]|nr:hypothetical protein F5B20DRAFT_521365 [Whalleya microplaca]